MAGLASQIYGTQMVEHFDRLGRAGMDVPMVRKLLGNDDLTARWVARLKQEPEFRLVHGIYVRNTEILPIYDAECVANNVDVRKFWWEGSPDPLDYTDDPGDVVILDRCFGSLEQEQQIVWSWVARQQQKSWWWPEFKTDAEHFFLRGKTEYPSWRQRWVRFSRTANYGLSPESVLTDERPMPGREILAMLAQHPEVARRMDGSEEHPYLWMAGLECRVPGYERRLVPSTWFYAGDSKLDVNAYDRGRAAPAYAVPEFLGK